MPPADSEFFAALADVVFSNPFSAKRAALIARLAPGAKPGDLTEDPEALARLVAPRLAPWMSKRLADEERRLIEPALLYVTYHRYVPRIDAHIERQAKQGGAPLVVPFAEEVLSDFVENGFSADAAARYLALYFQLRRAFYFIYRSLAGECESMQRLREALWNNVFTHDMRGYDAALWHRMEDFSTLLLGETGTGKGQAAAAIGRSGFIPYLPAERRFAANFAETFIAINLSQFPESLIESELFGHRKGAFTGAIDHHEGVFERCSAHGALFLDEIGEVSVPIQIKLLQVLQERTFTPLGGREKRRFSGRVIAATNQPPDSLRRDFFYRLCSDVIHMPTLRQRIAESDGELPELVRILVERITGSRELVDKVLESLPKGHAWPGNVRELEQAVRRILLTGRYTPEVGTTHLDEDAVLVEKLRAGELTAAELLARYSAMLHRRLGTYAEVAKRTGLDPRTTRKYIDGASAKNRGQSPISHSGS